MCASASYYHYVPATIGGVRCLALVDSGNVWRTAISAKFARRLGLRLDQLRPVGRTSVATAKEGAQLAVLGEPAEAVSIRLGSMASTIQCKPVVIQGLTMDVNLAGPFLQRHQIDQLHSEQCLLLDGVKIPLANAQGARAGQAAPPVASAPAYARRKQVVPARSVATIWVDVPAVRDGAMLGGDVLFEGAEAFMETHQLHPWVAAITHCDEQGAARVGVMNTLAHPVTIQRGARVGSTAVLATNGADGIAVLDAPDPPGTKPAARPHADWNMAEKTAWLRTEFRLDNSPWLRDKKDLAAALAMLLRHWEVFSTDGEFGKTCLIQHEIVTSEHPPIKCKHRPINPVLEED